ncbi:DUF4333 domain-containing protein [Nocardia otitidiscaviarum]|uniref:DUF4333 domain-containing protein n=1 Tax=Nocardia otitidiscaviarum TaxID=1823 RepID=UPI001895BB7E|nr:DUF4333 domain-containing protein [Nocardia otitidiscaviarum]MBF6138187.1 DUF4333 domain-containing protein [Nocardia otitidiscaviarum]
MSALLSARRRSARALSAFVFVLGVALAATACSVSIGGDPVVEETELENSIKQTLTDQVGVAPDAIDCPGDLRGKEGTTMRCTLTAGADTLGLTVTVTGTDGDTVNYDVQVDES